MTLDESILAMRLRVMRRAPELGNVRAACDEAGISRTLFTAGARASSAMFPTGCIPVAARRGPAGRRSSPPTSSGWSWGWPWRGRRGGVAG